MSKLGISLMHRRGFIQAVGATGLIASTGIGIARAVTLPTPYAAMRQTWVEIMTGAGSINPGNSFFTTALTSLGTSAEGFWNSMTVGGWSLWPDIPPNTSANVTSNFSRLRTMATAWVTPGTSVTGNATMLQNIIYGLDFMVANAYNPSVTFYGNWWDWNIGSPEALLDTALIVIDSLTQTQINSYVAAVDYFVPTTTPLLSGGVATGANLVDTCRVLITRGILGQSAAKIQAGSTGLSPCFPYVTTSDGLYTDGSFIQHGTLPYAGGYGSIFLNGIGRLLGVLAGTSWAITDPQVQNVFDSVTKAFAPFMSNGLIMDSVRGRGISNWTGSDFGNGLAITAAVLMLAKGASPAQAATFRALAKGWIQRNSYYPYATYGSVVYCALAYPILNDSSITPAAESQVSAVFGCQDRIIIRRPTWRVALAMNSKRISYYECINGENLKGWHTSDGMMYLYNDNDLGQFSDTFWPTVDPYKLPGTTISQKPLSPPPAGSNYKPRQVNSFTGGVTNGYHMVGAMNLVGLNSTLTTKKSWFSFSDRVICLGAGITCTDGQPVYTTVENRSLKGTTGSTFTVDGAAQPGTLGWTGSKAGAGWACLDGVAGYIFLDSPTLNMSRTQRTGSWYDIDTIVPNPPTSVTENYLTLWLNHGSAPSNASYAYMVLPGLNATQTAARAASSGVQILANTPNQQGVKVAAIGMTGINFWIPGTVDALTVDQPASVLTLENADGTGMLCISDPKQAVSTINLTWARPIISVPGHDAGITVVQTGSQLKIIADVSELKGKTLKVAVVLG